MHARLGHAEGVAHYLLGQMVEAEAVLAQALQHAIAIQNRNMGLDIAAYLCFSLVEQGRLKKAEQAGKESLSAFFGGLAGEGETAGDGTASSEATTSPVASAVYLALARTAYEQSDLQLASTYLNLALRLGQRAGWPHFLWQIDILQAQLSQAMGDSAAATAAVDQARQLAQSYGVPWVSRRIRAYEIRFLLVQGYIDQAVALAKTIEPVGPIDGGDADEMADEFEDLTLARVWLAQGKTAEVIKCLEALRESAMGAQRRRSLVEIQIQYALAREAQQDISGARDALRVALALAEPEGLTQVFLDEGQPMKDLLMGLDLANLVPAHAAGGAQLKRLMALLDPDHVDKEPTAESKVQPLRSLEIKTDADAIENILIEPLTGREIEVLQLLSKGLTLAEVAKLLYLSPNTLKAHTQNIYSKFNVHSRMEAVNKARALGLI